MYYDIYNIIHFVFYIYIFYLLTFLFIVLIYFLFNFPCPLLRLYISSDTVFPFLAIWLLINLPMTCCLWQIFVSSEEDFLNYANEIGQLTFYRFMTIINWIYIYKVMFIYDTELLNERKCMHLHITRNFLT